MKSYEKLKLKYEDLRDLLSELEKELYEQAYLNPSEDEKMSIQEMHAWILRRLRMNDAIGKENK